MLITLNQDTMDRHLHLMGRGSVVLYNADKIKPGDAGRRRAAVSVFGQGARARAPRATWSRTPSRWRRSCN